MYRGGKRWIFCREAAGDDDHLAFYGNRRIIEIASPFSRARFETYLRARVALLAREPVQQVRAVDATSIIFWIATAKKMQ